MWFIWIWCWRNNKSKYIKKLPEIYKQLEIEKNDERNSTISNIAKSKAYDSFIYIFGAVLLYLAIAVSDIFTIIVVVISYLCVVGINVYYHIKLKKEM